MPEKETMPSEYTPGLNYEPKSKWNSVDDDVIYSPDVGKELNYPPPTTISNLVKDCLPLIGFCGYKGSGKDQAAELLLVNGYSSAKMAGGLKAMMRALLDFRGCPADHIERMIEGDKKEWPTYFLGGKSPRVAMQTLGTEWGRDLINQSLWTESIADHIREADTNLVVTDIRFHNEVDLIHELGGVVIRIHRPSAIPEGSLHESENLISELDDDYQVNNVKSIKDLYAETSAACDFLATRKCLGGMV